MSDSTSKRAGNAPKISDEASQMSPALEAHALIPEIAGPMPAGSQVQEMLVLVSRQTGIGFRRVRALWHGEARRIDSGEMDALRRAAAARNRTAREAHDRAEYQELKAELAAMGEQLAALAALVEGAAAGRPGAAAHGPRRAADGQGQAAGAVA